MIALHPPPLQPPRLRVRDLLNDPALRVPLRLLTGERGLDRVIDHPRIQKSGLALVGHLHGLVPTRVQILGETELSFALSLDAEQRHRAARWLFSLDLACVVVTRGVEPPSEFVEAAQESGTPLLVSAERSSVTITAIHTLLDERLAPRTRVHGVVVDVFEVGVLLLGRSGIGKSELALELVMRGHRLVADDIVECDYRPPGMVFAEPVELLRHHIEVRGLGILDIRALYGVTAIRERKRIDLVARLEEQEPERGVDRLGQAERWFELLGVQIREIVLPVRPGRNTSAIIEIAARNELLRQAGQDASTTFLDRVEAGLRDRSTASGRGERPLSPRDAVASTRTNDRAVESSVPPPLVPRIDKGTNRT